MAEVKRCIHARQAQRMVLYQMGHHLETIEGSWQCGLALQHCIGEKDPGCGRYEI